MDTFQISTTLNHNKTHEPACRTRQESYVSMTIMLLWNNSALTTIAKTERFKIIQNLKLKAFSNLFHMGKLPVLNSLQPWKVRIN